MKELLTKAMEEVISNGTLEKMIEDQLNESVKKMVQESFRWSGKAHEALKAKIDEIMISAIEGSNYSDFITKMDVVLTEVAKEINGPNEKIINNFVSFAKDPEDKKITFTDLATEYIEFIQSKPGYTIEDADEVEINIFSDEYAEKPDWSTDDHKVIYFENSADEDLNYELHVWKFGKRDYYTVYGLPSLNIASLRRISKFEAYLLGLSNSGIEIELDDYSVSEEYYPQEYNY